MCVIPARGGSKRIPRKNIKPFLGKPIIAYSIETALNSGLFDEVMVSTDDDQIASIARQYGAKVPFMRGAENSNDFATTLDVLKEVLGAYNDLGFIFDTCCCIYPTAPFVVSELLIKAKTKLETGNFDCVFPVVGYSYPIQRALKITKTGCLELINNNFLTSRSQDLDVTYHDAGQFYMFRVKEVLQESTLWPKRSAPIVLDELRVQDIDNESDWKLAELKYGIL
ncbi:pseudaminic acid cytidylyltransferase [Robertkochia marina]|uniref:Pseudaminic acid cytidylyltransferase n=1 Tax=Robertkochia marina TaxID=1227945 RepID=A0A4S3M253_9FLAO|nr:pseudaminic acid cytidylyltransferase [Robertkochia marina]TRZ43467.1 pseudaminic acid cytidylyltransferase [Robertkochia marina]